MTDPDNNPVSIKIAAITQDEPVNGLGDGDTALAHRVARFLVVGWRFP